MDRVDLDPYKLTKCCGFIHGSQTPIILTGPAKVRRSLAHHIDQGFRLQDTESAGLQCGLYALEISLAPIYVRLSKESPNFDRLRAIHRGKRYQELVMTYVISTFDEGLWQDKYKRLMTDNKLDRKALEIVLQALCEEDSLSIHLGVCSQCSQKEVYLTPYTTYECSIPSISEACETIQESELIAWVAHDDAELNGGYSHWCGIAPDRAHTLHQSQKDLAPQNSLQQISPQKPTPHQAPQQQLDAIISRFHTSIAPLYASFTENARSSKAKNRVTRKYEGKLREILTQQILLKLNMLEIGEDKNALARRNVLIEETQTMLANLDEAAHRREIASSHASIPLIGKRRILEIEDLDKEDHLAAKTKRSRREPVCLNRSKVKHPKRVIPVNKCDAFRNPLALEKFNVYFNGTPDGEGDISMVDAFQDVLVSPQTHQTYLAQSYPNHLVSSHQQYPTPSQPQYQPLFGSENDQIIRPYQQQHMYPSQVYIPSHNTISTDDDYLSDVSMHSPKRGARNSIGSDAGFEVLQFPDNNQKFKRTPTTSIRDAPPSNTYLPIEQMADITLEELVVYFPNHVLQWPGLALLLRASNWNQLFARVAKYINRARGSDHLESCRKHVLRNSCRPKVESAIKELLGDEYNLMLHDARYATFITPKFLEENLWSLPAKFNRNNARSVDLVEVGGYVVQHQFYDRPFTARLRNALDPRIRCVQAPPQYGHHRLIAELYRHSSIESTGSPSSSVVLNSDCYPEHLSRQQIIEQFPNDLFGEVYLYVFLQYENPEIVSMLPFSYVRQFEGKKQLEVSLRGRKRAAILERAKRSGRSKDEEAKLYEDEVENTGYKKRRKVSFDFGGGKIRRPGEDSPLKAWNADRQPSHSSSRWPTNTEDDINMVDLDLSDGPTAQRQSHHSESREYRKSRQHGKSRNLHPGGSNQPNHDQPQHQQRNKKPRNGPRPQSGQNRRSNDQSHWAYYPVSDNTQQSYRKFNQRQGQHPSQASQQQRTHIHHNSNSNSRGNRSQQASSQQNGKYQGNDANQHGNQHFQNSRSPHAQTKGKRQPQKANQKVKANQNQARQGSRTNKGVQGQQLRPQGPPPRPQSDDYGEEL